MTAHPLVSIVIPTYNEVDVLRESLPTVFAQDYDNYEVILVDDGSTDDTVAFVQQFAANEQRQFQLISQQNAGSAAARNTGWKHAKGEIVAFIDTGCHADAQWISELVLSMGNAGGVGGKIILQREHSALTRYIKASRQYRHRIRNGQVEYLISANAAFKRQALEQVQGFREWQGVGAEDVDLSYRIINAGYQLGIAERAVVYHYDSADHLIPFGRKYFKRGYANYYYSLTWQRLGYSRSPLFELLRHCGAVVLAPYLAARYASRTRWRDLPSYIFIAIVEHLAFSLGLLNAMFKRDRYQVQDTNR